MKLTAIAIDDLEKLGIEIPNECHLTPQRNIIPDTYGEPIGRYNIETGTYESFFKKDIENNNTEIFDKCKNNCKLYKKRKSILSDDHELNNVIDYYLIYNIKESSRNRPTETNPLVDSCICSNGYYECEYELVFAKEDYSRTIVLKDKTNNNTMYDFINSLEDEINEILVGNADETNLFYHILEQKECSFMDDEYTFKLLMFDKTCATTYVDIESSDLLDMLVSVRLLSSKFIER